MTDNNSPAVRFSKVSRHFGEVKAVDGVDLDILDGEFFTMLGPSGSGKTTCLRLIAGFERPDAGYINLYGQDVSDLPPYERDVNTVFQDYALFPHMTVGQNVGYGLMIKKVAKAEREKRVREMLELVRLGGLENRKPGQLSGGQRQRVALGRATIRNPAVFLMDEPLSNLDAILRVQMRDELLRLHERLQTTMIYVTHDQVEAMTMGHRIVVMNNGLVQQVGPPQAVYDLPVNEFVAGFLGSPRINLIPGRLERTNGHWNLQGKSFSLPLGAEMGQRLAATSLQAGDNVTLGIRPEDADVISAQDQPDLRGEVHLIEPIGSDKYVSVRLGEEECMVRTSPRLAVEKGDAINLRFDWQRAHIFDSSGSNVFAMQNSGK